MNRLLTITYGSWLEICHNSKSTMRLISAFTAAAIPVLLGSLPTSLCAAEPGVALAIIYDSSGSMRETVRDRQGSSSPKYLIGNRALAAVADQVQAFATPKTGASPREVHAGLFIFQGSGARAVVPFGPLDSAAIKNWAAKFSQPNGSTPLGNAMQAGHDAVMKSPLPRKHVLVITDGENTAGPNPAAVLPRLGRSAGQDRPGVSFHFVAFDVDAKVFAPIKKLGATVVSASDEQQLNSQLGYILQEKILLEEEEPKKN